VVEVALQLLKRESSSSGEKGIIPRLLDIGTGSGCIAIALATELPQAKIWASDISPAALTVAIDNAQHHGVAERITFLQADLLASVAKEAPGFHLIAANLPYIARPDLTTLQSEVRDWEPRHALDGGMDGLDFYRRLLDECPAALRPGGWVVLEIGQGQSEQVMRLAGAQQNLTECRCVADYAGYPRVVVAHRV
jgi:release factor glutamine methyltransferase